MKSIVNYLFFDKDMVEKMKSSKFSKDQLYIQLMSGKITLLEYAEMVNSL